MLVRLYCFFQDFNILWLPPLVSTVSPVLGLRNTLSRLRRLVLTIALLSGFFELEELPWRIDIRSLFEQPCFFIKLLSALLIAFSFLKAALRSMLLSSLSIFASCCSSAIFLDEMFTAPT